ncbi:efflux RND transporter periplasmic adaptor subunit [Niveibacterium terrae]|uniref:efflux RND transporter periplasmic adaptor subunit n=1 Tax=Niveibacterium terrae TaxID=3373598 RepID=UPI003A916B43
MPEVGVITVRAREFTRTTELPGRTTAQLSAQIRPQIGGIIQKRVFAEGGEVKAGDLLYQIDPSTYQAAYDSAKASVDKARATLNAATLKANRLKDLLAISTVSRQDFEDGAAAQQEAAASLALAKAELESARINLAHTRITSPVSGRVETSSVTPGALVTANQETALTTVQQLDPIYVDIPQSSVQVLQLRNALARGQIKDAGGAGLPVRLTLEDGSPYRFAGKLLFTGASVTTSTGMITLRALVPNPEHLLMPGMYVKARLDQGVVKQAILVPQEAVTRTDSDATVLVVGRDGKAAQRSVAVADAVGHDWYVTSGLAEGEKVVVEGQAKIKPGQLVHASEIASAPLKAGKAASAAKVSAK